MPSPTATPRFGIDRLLTEQELARFLAGKRIGLVAHPASVTADMVHSVDALAALLGDGLRCAFGPQHGMKGDKQYNMVESEDELDPVYGIPVFSLYGEHRRPTAEQLSLCDGILFDLQDVGCRIYTYLTTLLYMMEACAAEGKFLWVLDRPNPAGRAVEGSILRAGNESFVGMGPVIMRHGLTLGEMALWIREQWKLSLDLRVIPMEGYSASTSPGYGWPLEVRSWVNPSPNLPTLSGVRCYAGTVMLEGTTLSEGRGTTRPLEGFGAPDVSGAAILKEMHRLHEASGLSGTPAAWMGGCLLRPFFFEPTFYKHQGKLCSGIQFHVDHAGYRPEAFKPYRLQALAFKALRQLYPDYPLWRDFAYEYVYDRLAIDVITGCETLRTWVDDAQARLGDLEAFLAKDEKSWREQSEAYLLYR
ncbi:Protein of unknown function (DUF1343) [gamma proteobacterium HdN1]|nr:Protein of unknown function (DUF1343) [gamma proteobacterium HdN1]